MGLHPSAARNITLRRKQGLGGVGRPAAGLGNGLRGLQIQRPAQRPETEAISNLLSGELGARMV